MFFMTQVLRKMETSVTAITSAYNPKHVAARTDITWNARLATMLYTVYLNGLVKDFFISWQKTF